MSEQPTSPIALQAGQALPRTKPSKDLEPFPTRMAPRIMLPLGDQLGLQNFGVNHVEPPPDAVVAVHHCLSVQNEFVFVLTGEVILVHHGGVRGPTLGMSAVLPHLGTAHNFVNR